MYIVFLSADRFETGSPRETNLLGAYYRKSALTPNKKRQTVGGPFAAPSGGMSDVRSLEQVDHSSRCAGAKDN